MKSIILFVIAIGSVLVATASDDVRVLSMRGQVTAKVGRTAQSLRSGVSLPMNATLVIGQGGYVALLTSKGAMRELRLAGMHKIDTLFTSKETSSTLSRVAKYVYANAYEKQVATSETGTVYRTQSVIPVWPPNLITDSAVITMSWLPVRGYSGSYELIIRDDRDSALYNATVADTSVSIDAGAIAGSYQGRCVYWTVQMARDVATASKPRCLTLASVDDMRELGTQVQELQLICQSNQEHSSSDICKVLIGALYEEQGFYEHARKEYASQKRDGDGVSTDILLQNCLQRGRE